MTAENSYESLAPYYTAARRETDEHRQMTPIGDLNTSFTPSVGFAEALVSNPDVAVIAEHKRRSPSEGDIRTDSSVTRTVERYRQGGATALSILTEGEHFGGRLSDVAEAGAACRLPILRKDFISDEYQLHEAKHYGAAAALLIVGGLSDVELKRLYREAENVGLDALVEVHDQEELERALEIEPSIIGVNNRNLSTLQVDLDIARNLVPLIPEDVIKVAESGYELRDVDGVFTYEHIRELRELGVDAVLLGTALMREADPAAALKAWLTTAL